MIDFVYEEDFIDLVTKGIIDIVDVDEDDMGDIRGLTFDNGHIWINMSASQWKVLPEGAIIEEMTKTIIHEHIHSILHKSTEFKEGEEHICQLMAGQEEIAKPR